MDGNNNFNIQNWGYNAPAATSFESHLGQQYMPYMPENPMHGGHNVAVSSTTEGEFYPRSFGMPQAAYPMDYMEDTCLNNQRDMNMSMITTIPSFGGISGTSPVPNHMQVVQSPELSNGERQMEEAPVIEKAMVTSENGQSSNPSIQQAPRVSKKTLEVVINGINFDISNIPVPICSCTGIPRKCYKWGIFGWQSSCCTKDLSMYPLPITTKLVRKSRIPGRKMTIGAFTKVIEKLLIEGYNFSDPIDLRSYWAKHGTNKFVTFR